MSFEFQTGDTVELEVVQANNRARIKVKTLVERSLPEGSFVIHAPIYEGRVMLIQVNDRLKIYFSEFQQDSERYDIYCLNTVVSERFVEDNIPMLQLEACGEIEKVQRRDFFRLSYINEMTVLPTDRTAVIPVVSRDISLGGLRFACDVKFAKDEQLTCYLRFDEHLPIEVSGIVLSSHYLADQQMHYEVRVQFVGLSNDKKSQIIKHINRIQAAYLKKISNETYQAHLSEIMPHFSAAKIDQSNEDTEFETKLGYFKGMTLLGQIAGFAMFVIAHPNRDYPMSKFIDFHYSEGWNYEFLLAGVVLSALLWFLSIAGIVIKQRYYEDVAAVDLVLVGSALCSTALIVLNLFFIATKF